MILLIKSVLEIENVFVLLLEDVKNGVKKSLVVNACEGILVIAFADDLKDNYIAGMVGVFLYGHENNVGFAFVFYGIKEFKAYFVAVFVFEIDYAVVLFLERNVVDVVSHCKNLSETGAESITRRFNKF